MLFYIKTAYRNFINQRPYSFINLIGLSLGLWIVLLSLLMVTHHTGFDTFHKNYKNIYRVLTIPSADKQQVSAITNPLEIEEMAEEFPEIKGYVRLQPSQLKINDAVDYNGCYYADSSVVDVFSFELLFGAFDRFKKDPNTVIVSESFASKYFVKEKDVVGKQLEISSLYGEQEGKKMTIVAVFEDLPIKSTFRPNILLPISNSDDFQLYRSPEQRGARFLTSYLTLREGSDWEGLEKKMNEGEQEWYKSTYKLQPLEKVHLYSEGIAGSQSTKSIKGVLLYSGIGMLALLVSLLNFMLLYSAISERSIKNMALRKVMGMENRDTLKMIFAESLLMCFMAAAFGFLILKSTLPYFNGHLQDQLVLSMKENWSFFVGSIILVFMIAALSSLYFYRYVSRHQVVEVLEKQASQRHNLFFGNGVILAQLVIVTAMLVFSFAYYKQLGFMMNQGKGFNTDNLLTVYKYNQSLDEVQKGLFNLPEVLAVSASQVLPIHGSSQKSIIKLKDQPSKEYALEYMNVDESFISLYDIELKKGRNFSKEFSTDLKESLIINEAAAKFMELDDPIGVETNIGRVIGVVDDFKFETFKKELRPLFLRMEDISKANGSITIKYKEGRKTVTAEQVKHYLESNQIFVASTISDFKDHPKGVLINSNYVNDIMERMYGDEKTLQKVVSFFTLMAILISLMGIVGMFLYKTERRAKEIGIRKVNGASVKEILLMLNGDFAKWIVLAFVIACPVAYYVTQKWLENFAYKTTLDWWIFGLAGLLTLIVALLTVSGLSYRAAITNPVNVLKDE
ncbi:ABC transporter permease [Echinicola salinicaeni]|uniref:ABC transporter permease n=1 Tax=Echinicola salinicaeni TaxID=2762757 RepID=UPI001645812C|nr:ABC transporter permease [Echinicola salinicaeni]